MFFLQHPTALLNKKNNKDDFIENLKINIKMEILYNISYSHLDSSDWLLRSYIRQYQWGYCKLEYLSGYYKGTLTLL